MQIDEFSEQITQAFQRAIDLERTSDQLPLAAVLAQSFEELHSALEELHAAQEELRQQQSELLASQAGLEAERRRYQELFDFAPDGYLVTDLHGVIREANFAAASLLGVQRGFLNGMPLVRYLADAEARRQFFAYLSLVRQSSDVQEWDGRLQPARG